MRPNKNILIIGIDSLIGKNLFDIYKKNGWNVIGTSRKTNNNKDVIFFQLGNNIKDLFLDDYQICILCAAITNIEEGEKKPINTREINVLHTIEIIKECHRLNIFTIFLSSDLVFSGERMFPDVKDKAFPKTNNGRFKLEVERFISSLNSNNFSILRLTKVISEETPILRKWSQLLTEGINIEAFDDVYISPVEINKALRTIYEISKNRFSGLYQLGGDMVLSYFEFAKFYFKDKGINTKLIKPINSQSKIIYHRYSSLKIVLPIKLINE